MLGLSDEIHHLIINLLRCMLISVLARQPSNRWTKYGLPTIVGSHLAQRARVFDFSTLLYAIDLDLSYISLSAGLEEDRSLPIDVGFFDVTEAVLLHNWIVDTALNKTGGALAEHVQYNWFALHGEVAERYRPYLSASLIEFLENIKVWDDQKMQFIPHLAGVGHPNFFWQYDPWSLGPNPGSPELRSEDRDMFEESFGNSVVLYRDNHWEEGRGFVFNMDCNCGHLTHSIYDGGQEDDIWIELQWALKTWAAEVEKGRYIVDPEGKECDTWGNPKYWIEKPWIPLDLRQTLDIWDRYLDLIENRMGVASSNKTSLVSVPLVSELPIDDYLKSFLRNARQPNFVNIAPTLFVLDDAFLHDIYPTIRNRSNLVQENTNYRYYDDFVTLLLFPSSVKIPAPSPLNPIFRDRDWMWHAPYWHDYRILDGRYGIYLTDYTEVTMVVPRTLDEVTHMRFYSPGWRAKASLLPVLARDMQDACIPTPPFRLFELLALWYDKVASGEWHVGSGGVEGEIEDLWAILPDHWSSEWE